MRVRKKQFVDARISVRVLSLVTICALILMGAFACGQGGQGEAGKDTPIQIGFSAELSGSAAEGGEAMWQGVEIAADITNEEGGINGRPVKIVKRDTEMDPTRGVSIIREFAQQDVVGVVGGYLSTVMLAQSPIIATEQMPFMVATSNVPESVEQGLPWTFGVRMNAPVTARYTLDFLERNFDTNNKIAILHESGGYGQGAAEAMTGALKEIGEKPVAVESFNLEDTDMTAQVTRARNAGAEAVYLMGIGASNGYVLRDMARIGWEVPVVGEMGMVQTAVPEIAGKAANGTYVIQTANYAGEQPREMSKKLVNKAKEKYGSVPSMAAPSAQGFDATMMLVQAIEKVELTGDIRADREAVREALETKVGPYKGVITDWEQPFHPNDHDAVGVDDYLMTVWTDSENNPELVKSPEQ